MSSVAQRLLTAEEYWQSPLNTKHSELVRGEVVKKMPPGALHGAVAATIAMLLRLWTQRLGGGYVAVEAGYMLRHDPDTLRGPDVSYVSLSRIPPGGLPEAFWNLAPDLAVEVVSPSESASDIREKVRDFLAAGTPVVWVVFPSTREVLVHTADGLARTYGENDVLEHQEVRPGFSCRVAELFD